jgi:hypothetical protein
MADKHPNTERWGGPGASHEDRTEPPPKKTDPRAPGEPTNTPFSHVSGGGGERDRHHGHDAHGKRDFEENSEERRKP